MKRCLRQILWLIWKRKTPLSTVVYAMLAGLLFYAYSKYKMPSYDLLKFLAKLLSYLNEKIPAEHPWINIVLSLFLTGLITLLIGYIIKYWLLPGNKSALLDALIDRCYEITELGCKRIERDIEDVWKWVDGLRTGCPITPEKCQVLGREVVEITRAKKLYATCLQTPEEVYDNLKGFSEIIAEEIRKRGKELVRVIICDPDIFDLNIATYSTLAKEKIKWFVKLHINCLKLKYIKQNDFLDITTSCGITRNKLDIMLFDDKIVWSLENDGTTFKVIKNNGNYILSLMDSDEDIKSYKGFVDKLNQRSSCVTEYINNNNWKSQYS